MNKRIIFGLTLATLTIASIPLMPNAAQAWGNKYRSPVAVSGDACVKNKGDRFWTCYDTPGGNQGVRITTGNRRIRF